MVVVISLNDMKLKQYLNKSTKSYHYVYFGARKQDIAQLLDKGDFKEIKIDEHDDSSRDRFLKLYIDLIGRLGLKYDSIYWWATFAAAKNSIVSGLLSNLSVFYSLVNMLGKDGRKNVIVINPPEEICSSLAKYWAVNSIEVKALSDPLRGLAKVIRQAIINGIINFSFIYLTWKKIRISKGYLKNRLVSLDKRAGKYYVLRSWIYGRSFDENDEYHDAFFGILPDYLLSKGQKLVILGGVIGDYKTIVRRMASNKQYLIIPPEYFIKYVDPIKAVLRAFLHRLRIREKVDLDGLDVTDIVRSDLSATHHYTAAEYLHSYCIRGLLKRIDVDTFTTTYENNPWEKMCFYALRRYSPETRIIGYQHVPLSRAHLGMFMTEYEKEVMPMPDKINTIGKVTKELLQNDGNYDQSKLRASCALRFQIPPAGEMVRRRRSNRILVALRGFFPSVRLVNFVHQGLKDSTQYQIIVRPHPALPFEQFKGELVFDVASSPSFSVSDITSLREELAEVDIVVHEGSAVAIEALMMGIPVILVDLGDPASWDSLFQCDYFRWVVDREEDLQATIDAIYSLSDDEYCGQQSKARQYLEDYVYAVTDERLDEFIV